MIRPSRLRERPSRRFVPLLALTTPAFESGARIPVDYTRDGRNRSPELRWTEAPDGTRSFAVLCEDPDAPMDDAFVHWILFDIPAGAMGLPLTGVPEAMSRDPRPHDLPGAVQGSNDFGNLGYDGPFPPPGHKSHHYHFIVTALDTTLNLRPGTRKPELLRAMEGHVQARGEIVGMYSR